MRTERFDLGDTSVQLWLDETSGTEPGLSRIRTTHPGGWDEELMVPGLDADGLPSMKFVRQPSMDDLRRMAMLRVTYLPFLITMSEDEKLDLARTVSSEPPADDSTYRWLLILEKAVADGVIRKDSGTPSVPHELMPKSR